VTGGHLHANAGFDDEPGRLRLLEACYDPGTFARLSMSGPPAGVRCLEVGAVNTRTQPIRKTMRRAEGCVTACTRRDAELADLCLAHGPRPAATRYT
jgi:hypothetical protein